MGRGEEGWGGEMWGGMGRGMGRGDVKRVKRDGEEGEKAY